MSFPGADAYTELLRDISATETTIPVLSTAPFTTAGRIWIGGEPVLYTGKTDTAFTGLTRDVVYAKPHAGGDHVMQGNIYIAPDGTVQMATSLLIKRSDTAVTGPNLVLDTIAAGQHAELWFQELGTNKWAVYNQPGTQFGFFNAALSRDELSLLTSGGAILNSLAGAGSRLVKADAAGLLSATLSEMGDVVHAGSYSGVTGYSLPNGTFDNTKYRNYIITINNTNSTVGQDLRWRARASGADDAGTGTYQYAGLNVNGGQPSPAVIGGYGTTGAGMNAGIVYAGIAGGTSIDMGTIMFVESPHDSSTRTKVIALTFGLHSGFDWRLHFFGAEYAAALKAHDALTLFPSANTISGTVRVAGLRDS